MNLRFWTVQFWKETGYGLGSSQFLVRKIVSIADIQDASIIVELGGWEWQVTKYLLEKKSPQTKLIVIENDHEKFLMLSEKYGHLCEVHEMSAAHSATWKYIEPRSWSYPTCESVCTQVMSSIYPVSICTPEPLRCKKIFYSGLYFFWNT